MLETVCKVCSVTFFRTKSRQERLCETCKVLFKREANIRKRYGINLETYQKAYKKQKGMCAICKKKYPLLHIDHNHGTNKVRGLLCSNCNTGIGLLREDVSILASAIQYIELHKG